MPSSVEEHIREIADRVAGGLGLELVGVEFRGVGGKSRMLRVFIDRPAGQSSPAAGAQAGDGSGVTHDDCVSFSNEFGTILDAEDAIPGSSYTLEVSSPGLDRKLVKPEDYQRFAGHRIRLTTREAIDGRRNFQGRLEGLSGTSARLILGESKPPRAKGTKREEAKSEGAAAQISIELGNIEKANLVPEF